MNKKLLALVIVFAAMLGIAASAPDPFAISTSTSSATSLTTVVTVDHLQGYPSADGSLTLQVYMHTHVTAADGTVVADRMEPTPLNVPLSSPVISSITAAIAAAQSP